MTRCVLPFQKIWVQFPAPKSGSSQPQQFHSRRIWGLCPLWTPARLCTHSLFSICPVSNHSYDLWSTWWAWTFVSSHCVKTMFLGAIGMEVWQAVGEKMIKGVSTAWTGQACNPHSVGHGKCHETRSTNEPGPGLRPDFKSYYQQNSKCIPFESPRLRFYYSSQN